MNSAHHTSERNIGDLSSLLNFWGSSSVTERSYAAPAVPDVPSLLRESSNAQAIPLLLRDLSNCYDNLISENSLLATENVRLRSQSLNSAATTAPHSGASVQIENRLLADKIESRRLSSATQHKPGMDLEVELADEANCEVQEEMLSRDMEPYALDKIPSAPRETSNDEDAHADAREDSVKGPSFSLDHVKNTSFTVNSGPYDSETRISVMTDISLQTTTRSKGLASRSTTNSAASIEETLSPGDFTSHAPKIGFSNSVTFKTPRGTMQRDTVLSRASHFSSDNSYMSVLPKWFMRLPQQEKGGSTFNSKESLSEVMPEQETAEEWKGCCCVLDPTGRIRVSWDVCWCVVLVFEIWATPIQLVFVEDGALPQWWKNVLLVSFSFFVIDIVLNFFTGFFLDEVQVMNQRLIIIHYLKHWFLFDLVATIPWDMVTGDGAFSSATAGKGLKMMKMLKFFRVVKLGRVANTSKKAKKDMSLENVKRRREHQNSNRWYRRLGQVIVKVVASGKTRFAVQQLGVIALLAHFHGTIWALLKEDWSATRDMPLVFHRYLESFWWAFSSFTFGNTYPATKPAMWLFDIAVLFERLLLCAWISRLVVIKALMSRDSDSQHSAKSVEALRYMEDHDVSLKTELQVLKYWNESGKKRKRQRWFEELIDTSMPKELQHRINQELWSEKLRSLGLIEYLYELNHDFVLQLSQMVVEDIYASTMLVCKEGDAAKNAHYILAGELIVYTADYNDVPAFTVGMWIGEKALVNPELRRYGSVFAKTLSTLLSVPSSSFFHLMQHLGLNEMYKDFCSKELWKGLCGRCGSVGQHWAHECAHAGQTPTAKASVASSKAAQLKKSNKSIMIFDNLLHRDATKGQMQNDLKMFITFHKMSHLQEMLEGMLIFTLSDLEDRYKEVHTELKEKENLMINEKQLSLLTAREARFFRSKVSAQTRALLTQRASEGSHHYMFLSHYKLEAGTEAALMRSELESLIQEDTQHPAHDLKTPVYLDSEDLVDLHHLMDEVSSSHNLVLMLTKGILTRPWCLLEIATASRDKVPILPVNILKAGVEFTFPDEAFYKNMDTTIGASGVELIKQHGFEIDDVVNSCREVFKRIAVPYSPHRPATIRKVELQELLKQATLRDVDNPMDGQMSMGHSASQSHSVDPTASRSNFLGNLQ